MGRGYSGNHPRYSGERYDAKQAYNKDLTASARLHYLENDRHDHDSPHHMSVNERLDDSFGMGQNTGSAPSPMNNRADRIRERAVRVSERGGEGQGGYDYENPRVTNMIDRANKIDERSGQNSMRNLVGQKDIVKAPELMAPPAEKQLVGHPKQFDLGTSEYDAENRNREVDSMISDGVAEGALERLQMSSDNDSPFNACAKDEGGSGCIQEMGGAWRVISNKTDKPWPAKYGSKSKAEAALRGYHAG